MKKNSIYLGLLFTIVPLCAMEQGKLPQSACNKESQAKPLKRIQLTIKRECICCGAEEDHVANFSK